MRFFLSTIFFAFTQLINAQVGIGTTNPRSELDVAGDMFILGLGSGLQVTIPEVDNNEGFVLLTQTESGFIKDIDLTSNGKAFGYVQEYIISNMDGDWLNELNTNIDANKYRMVILSANFDREVVVPNESFIIQNVSSYVKNNKWHINADYPAVTTETGNGVWEIITMILPEDMVKEIPSEVVTLEGTNVARRGGEKSGEPIIK